MKKKLGKAGKIVGLSLAVIATLGLLSSAYSLTIDNTVPTGQGHRPGEGYQFGISPEKKNPYILPVGETMGLVAWVDYTDPETGEHTWVDGCRIKFVSGDTKIVKVDGKKATWHTTGESGGSPGHTAPVIVSGEGPNGTKVTIYYYLPDGSYLGKLEPAYTIFTVEIWDYLPFYILINRPWTLKAHPTPDLGGEYVWDATANVTISDPKLKDIQLTGTGPSSDPTADWVRVKYTPPDALKPAEASIELTVQVPSDLKEIADGVAPDGTMGQFSYQVLDQNKKDAEYAGMTALETIPSLNTTVTNYKTGETLFTESLPDPKNVPVSDTNADGQFTDTPIGAMPQSMTDLRNYYGVDVKVTTVRDKTYSVMVDTTIYPLGTFRQTIIQTAIKRGNKIVLGNEGVFETRL